MKINDFYNILKLKKNSIILGYFFSITGVMIYFTGFKNDLGFTIFIAAISTYSIGFFVYCFNLFKIISMVIDNLFAELDKLKTIVFISIVLTKFICWLVLTLIFFINLLIFLITIALIHFICQAVGSPVSSILGV